LFEESIVYLSYFLLSNDTGRYFFGSFKLLRLTCRTQNLVEEDNIMENMKLQSWADNIVIAKLISLGKAVLCYGEIPFDVPEDLLNIAKAAIC